MRVKLSNRLLRTISKSTRARRDNVQIEHPTAHATINSTSISVRSKNQESQEVRVFLKPLNSAMGVPQSMLGAMPVSEHGNLLDCWVAGVSEPLQQNLYL